MDDRTIYVWDPIVRLFHWGLVLSFATAWLSADRWDEIHEISGYIASLLIVIRLIWGFIGPHYARFAQFIRRPSNVVDFARLLSNRSAPRYIGHNPLGALMIVTLMACMGITGLTGWMYTTDKYWGVGWVENVHELGAELLLLLAALHVAGVIHASISHRENLVRSMLDGRKRAANSNDIA